MYNKKNQKTYYFFTFVVYYVSFWYCYKLILCKTVFVAHFFQDW